MFRLEHIDGNKISFNFYEKFLDENLFNKKSLTLWCNVSPTFLRKFELMSNLLSM